MNKQLSIQNHAFNKLSFFAPLILLKYYVSSTVENDFNG